MFIGAVYYLLITLTFFQGNTRSAFIARASSAVIGTEKSPLAMSCCRSSWVRAATSSWSCADASPPLATSRTKATSLLRRRIVLLQAWDVATRGLVTLNRLRGYFSGGREILLLMLTTLPILPPPPSFRLTWPAVGNFTKWHWELHVNLRK